MKNGIEVGVLRILAAVAVCTILFNGIARGAGLEGERLAVLIMPTELQTSVAKGSGYASAGLEVTSGDHQVTVKVINAALNRGSRSARQTEAARIAAVVEHEIAGHPEFSDIKVIHIDYVRRSGSASKAVQSFDFREAPDGRFVFHIT